MADEVRKLEWPAMDFGPDLARRAPCLPDERHTFGPDESVCLCGALRCGVTTHDPFMTLFTPNRARPAPAGLARRETVVADGTRGMERGR